MTRRLTGNGRKASVCGCSSMVEQKLPKLHPSALSVTEASQNLFEKSRIRSNAWEMTAKPFEPLLRLSE